MKSPRIVKSAELVGDFRAVIKFCDGSERIVDFTKIPLKGVFTKVQNDLHFFKTLTVKHGYVMWDGDLTIDSEFLYEHGKPIDLVEPLPAAGFVNKIESHYKNS